MEDVRDVFADNGIKVEILIGEQSQSIYRDPNLEETNNEIGELRYTEAVTDAKFAVKITLARGFPMYDADGVTVDLCLDGGHPWYHFLGKLDSRYSTTELSTKFTCFPEYHSKTREWREGEFCFGNLTVGDSTEVQGAPAKVKDLGTIHVTVTRVTRMAINDPPETKPTAFDTVTHVSEKLMKGKAVENTVKAIAGKTIPTPRRSYQHRPIGGSGGRPLHFRIFYRSRKALQILGCIPRTPSPDPEEQAQEVAALRARLARLERNLRLKPEPHKPSEASPTTFTSNAVRLKREHQGSVDDDDDDPEIVATKRARGAGTIEVVDLLDD